MTELKKEVEQNQEEFIYVVNPTKNDKKKLKKGVKGRKRQFLEMLPKKNFNVSSVCREMNLWRSTFYDWMEKDSKFKEVYEEIQERMIDLVEDSLRAQIAAKNTVATIFFLKTKAKHRGYVERVENVQVEEKGIKVIWGKKDGNDGNGSESKTNGSTPNK